MRDVWAARDLGAGMALGGRCGTKIYMAAAVSKDLGILDRLWPGYVSKIALVPRPWGQLSLWAT